MGVHYGLKPRGETGGLGLFDVAKPRKAQGIRGIRVLRHGLMLAMAVGLPPPRKTKYTAPQRHSPAQR